jgi:hypothetical protein
METTQQETPASAPETAQKPKKVIGRPFTKENAKQYQLSATQAKKRRKRGPHEDAVRTYRPTRYGRGTL